MDLNPPVTIEDKHVRHRYHLPYRLHSAKIYPLRSPTENLQIIVCGHASGIRLTWIARKPSNVHSESPNQSRIEDIDETSDSIATVAIRDIACDGSAALHLAIPFLPSNLRHETPSVPSLFSEKLIVAVACSDSSTKVLMAPLDPPKSSDDTDFRSKLLTLTNTQGSQNLPDSIAISFTLHLGSSTPDEAHLTDSNEALLVKAPLSQLATQDTSKTFDTPAWDLLIASHTPDLSGLLFIHRIPLEEFNSDRAVESKLPWQTHHLTSPAVSLCFSPSLFPSSLHSQLLITQQGGMVKILDSVSIEAGVRSHAPLTLFAPYDLTQSPVLPKRKRIICSAFVLAGKAVLMLLADGEWVLWDLERAAPKSTKVVQDRKGFTCHSIALQGTVNGQSKGIALHDDKRADVIRNTKLAPMTPSTRKAKADLLFGDRARQNVPAPVRGNISVVEAPRSLRVRADDQSVLFWYGKKIVIIPSFLAYWQSKAKETGSLLLKGSRCETWTTNSAHLEGELCQEVTICPLLDNFSTQLELLVTAERQVVVLGSKSRQDSQQSKPPGADESMMSTDEEGQRTSGDFDLDLNNMNRILDGMSVHQSFSLTNGSKNSSGSLL